MQLSKFSDYSFRALIYLARNTNRLCTVEELAENLCASEHHMKKVVHKLSTARYILSLKGRNGGIRLGMEPKDINLGNILRYTEENMNLLDCFTNDSCPLLSPDCKLKTIGREALSAFVQEFSRYSLQDLL